MNQVFLKKDSQVHSNEKCLCYYCCTEQNPANVTQWVPEAVCPNCGVDSVLIVSNSFSEEELQKLHQEMFKTFTKA